MYPFLKELDTCIVENISLGAIRAGDVVVYFSPEKNKTVIHRVVGVDREKEECLIKGDNEECCFAERIPFEAVNMKVAVVERGGGTFDLSGGGASIRNRFLAILSRYDLTPYMVYKKHIVPIVLFFMRTRLFYVVRTLFYRSFDLLVSRQEGGLRVHFMSRGHKAADIMLRPYGTQTLEMTSYVRMRDRNPFLLLELLDRVAHSAESFFGYPVEIKVSDPVVIPFISSVNARLKKDGTSRSIYIS